MTLLLIKISTSYLGGDKIDLKGVGLILTCLVVLK